jgi:hypothetical protein
LLRCARNDETPFDLKNFAFTSLGRLPALLRRSLRSRYDVLAGGRETDWDRASNGGSDKCGGIPVDSLITAAALALAAGDPLGALNRVALRDDAPALALRGIAMAQLGDLVRAKALVRSAARAFGPKEAVARARCVVAEAEIALASRELSWPAKAPTLRERASKSMATVLTRRTRGSSKSGASF